MRVFPNGYAGAIVRLAYIRTRSDVQALEPEMRRRVFRMMRHAARLGIPLGIGGGGRTTEQQTALFLARHYQDPAGSIYWAGERWSRRAGMSAAAPPGRSYHETTPPYGALAVDMVPPASLPWMNANAHLFGLAHFGDAEMREPWHVQPVELPRSRAAYNADPSRYRLARKVFLKLPPLVTL